ncbi:MAG: MarR family transcriptional regulator [Oscillospiraceae bacterium]|jgi:DNA-binding MarR family transcriptional regulator|nr:MarR family transcriptional regulator [Oscillospiraceae bacterium]
MIAFMKYINITYRCGVQYRGEQLIDYDLGGIESVYILHICNHPGLTQDALAKNIFINKSNVTRKLAVLEENGYVERRTREDDKRVAEVYPTQKALDALPKVRQVFHQWNEYITEDFTDEEKELLDSLLRRITEKAKRYAGKSAAKPEKEQTQP